MVGGGFSVFLLFMSRWEMGSWRVWISQYSSCSIVAWSRPRWTSWRLGGCFPAPGRRGLVKPCVVAGGVGVGVVIGCTVVGVVGASVAVVAGASVAVVEVVVPSVVVAAVVVCSVGRTWIGWGFGVVGGMSGE